MAKQVTLKTANPRITGIDPFVADEGGALVAIPVSVIYDLVDDAGNTVSTGVDKVNILPFLTSQEREAVQALYKRIVEALRKEYG